MMDWNRKSKSNSLFCSLNENIHLIVIEFRLIVHSSDDFFFAIFLVVNPISINGPNIDDQVVIDENSPPSQPPPSTLSSSSSYESTSSTQRNPTISSASTSYRNISPLFSSTNPFQANLGRQLMTNNNGIDSSS